MRVERIAYGRGRITNDSADIGKFKTPTLRNIELTAPYMHDGRFKTLEEVLDHYSDNMLYYPTIDSVFLKNDSQPSISLNEEEKKYILLFLKTLTDSSFVTNPLFKKK